MKISILYHPNTEFAGMSEDYKRDFEYRHPDQKIELVSLDTVQGSDLAKLYDIVRYPAILVTANDGTLQKYWQDRPWPPFDEVAAYIQ